MSLFSPFLQSLLNVGVALLVALPLLLCLFLYFNQERMLFFPRPLSPAARQMLQERSPQGEIRLTAADGTPLHGWLLNRPLAGRAPLLIYWGGNAEEVSGFLLTAAQEVPGWAVLAINYRGYGESGGQPGERALFEDARLIFDWAQQRPDVDPERIVVMGRSLGTGVAVHVAAERKVAGVCLVSPYDSIRSLAQAIYPVLPIGWLLKHPFDSEARAPAIQAPLLVLMASDDTIVPPRHSQRLIAVWGGPHQAKILPGVDHNSIASSGGYHDAIRAFLRSLRPDGA
ncbi:MAG: alpha/beta hydrolase [Magnetococcales bacterium]|nr:alpha/beta hydrolase [Magnetococcales bacterium]